METSLNPTGTSLEIRLHGARWKREIDSLQNHEKYLQPMDSGTLEKPLLSFRWLAARSGFWGLTPIWSTTYRLPNLAHQENQIDPPCLQHHSMYTSDQLWNIRVGCGEPEPKEVPQQISWNYSKLEKRGKISEDCFWFLRVLLLIRTCFSLLRIVVGFSLLFRFRTFLNYIRFLLYSPFSSPHNHLDLGLAGMRLYMLSWTQTKTDVDYQIEIRGTGTSRKVTNYY